MSRIRFIAIEGKHHLWKDILELRRTQLAATCAHGIRTLPATNTI